MENILDADFKWRNQGVGVDCREETTNLGEGGGWRIGHKLSPAGAWWLLWREKPVGRSAEAIPKVGASARKFLLTIEVI